MSRINMGRVILGGLVAGLVFNIGEGVLNGVVLAEAMETVLVAFGLSAPGGGAIAVFLLVGFAVGIVAVWLYAAIRPRYGAGPKTALCAGTAVWFLACVSPGVTLTAMGLAPTGPTLLALVWELIEVPLATLAGAWLYRE